MTTIYEEFKLFNGFSEKEITAKKKKFKRNFRTLFIKSKYSNVKRAGFKDVSSVAKFICFEGFLAIK